MDGDIGWDTDGDVDGDVVMGILLRTWDRDVGYGLRHGDRDMAEDIGVGMDGDMAMGTWMRM